jgi:hypothetical protein
MSIRLQILLNERDFRLLHELADREYREPRQMAGFLIREALQRRGLLAETPRSDEIRVESKDATTS